MGGLPPFGLVSAQNDPIQLPRDVACAQNIIERSLRSELRPTGWKTEVDVHDVAAVLYKNVVTYRS